MKLRRRYISILVITSLTTLLYSCECVVKPNCNGDFNFILRDKTTKRDLIQGPNAIYSLNTIKIISGTDTTQYSSPIEARQDLGILICHINGSSDTLYMKLNTSDIDTLLVSFRHVKRNLCCPSGSRAITGIIFNDVQTNQENGTFILEK